MLKLGLGISLSKLQSLIFSNVPTLSIVNSGTTGTMTIISSGLTSLTVDWSGFTGNYAVWNGVYTIDLTNPGPYVLFPSQVIGDGTPAEGEVLTRILPFVMADTSLGEITFGDQWYLNGVSVSGATSSNWIANTGGAGGNATVLVTVTQGSTHVTSESSAITIAPTTTPLSIARIGSTYLGSTTGTATPSFTENTSGLQVGDTIAAVFIGSRYASALSISGSGAFTKKSVDASVNGYGCVSVFRKTVTAGDIGTSKIFDVTTDQSASHHALVLYRIRGGDVSTVAIQTRGGVSTTLTATPSGATASALISVFGGIVADTTEPTFGGATKQGTSEIVTGTNRLVSSAVNTTPSSNTITAATATAFVAGLAVMAIA